MHSDDAASITIQEQDRQWMAAHQTQLWGAAQAGYAKYGRGVVLVIFEEVDHDEIVIAYTVRLEWPAPEIMGEVARYKPATQMVVVCMGQLVDTEVVPGPRAYVMQYLTPSA